MSATGTVFTTANQRVIYSLVSEARKQYNNNRDAHGKTVVANEAAINSRFRNYQDDLNAMADKGYLKIVHGYVYIRLN